ncbi:hypothetical protein [Mycobacterium sp. GA-2829]|uniref:hypothetical protein n=1 Tax=Mycobacterium sp. GA-2829 TaxID=1772283 RepID=UPI000740478D|nr:hypothetical protein [Mycobacterium sp. GA-2829]KUI27451.1 hypothetical protein AU194_02575 [Mycobacterium sp. GA-2829]
MHIDRTTVPGSGTLHHIVTRGGIRLAVLVGRDGDRQVFVYDDAKDEPATEVLLAPDEADGLAEILHSRPIADRVRTLERRVDALIGERGS